MHIQVITNSKFSVSAYDDTSITINEQKYRQSVFITSKNIQILAKNSPKIQTLSILDLPSLEKTQILILGGAHLSPIDMPQELKYALEQKDVSVEIMSLGAACRTFNLLLSEGREVACLILF